MDRKTLLYLAGAVGVLVVIVLIATGGGLNDRTKAQYDAEKKQYERAQVQFAGKSSDVLAGIKKHPKLFGAQASVWTDRLKKAGARLKAVETHLASATKLVAENDNKKRMEIDMAMGKVREARTFAMAELTQIQKTAEGLVQFKKERARNVAQAKQAHQSVQAADLSTIRAKVKQAKRDWPPKKSDLDRRFASLEAYKQNAARSWKRVQAEDAKDEGQIDYFKLETAVSTLRANKDNLLQANQGLDERIGQLYVSWEKVLIDMEIREGSEVTFYHKYRTTTFRIKPGQNPLSESEARGSEPEKVEFWSQVTKTTYERFKSNLGMAIAWKATGKYDNEEQKQAQPAGYSYMCSTQQRRNHYGYWRNDRWSWYPRYYYIGYYAWGPSYYPVYGYHYNTYYSHRSRGRTYYGSDRTGTKRYGSTGSQTKRSFGHTKYYRNSGYKNTKYARSGGKYRGSRYQTSRRSSSGGYRRSSYRSGGRSRSFGGK